MLMLPEANLAGAADDDVEGASLPRRDPATVGSSRFTCERPEHAGRCHRQAPTPTAVKANGWKLAFSLDCNVLVRPTSRVRKQPALAEPTAARVAV